MANYVRNSDNYHGRSKTSSGPQNSKKKSSGRSQRNLSDNNNAKDDYHLSRRPKCTMDDFLGTILPESSASVNAWTKGAPGLSETSQLNNGHKTVDQAFFWGDEKTYPAIVQPPVENIWEKRKEKLETRKAMEPISQTEEERMIQKAIELSQLEALEKEEKKKKLEEEYELQQLILKTNPTLFTEFQTTDELNLIVASNDNLDQEILESFCDDFVSNNEESNNNKETTYQCQKELEDYWSQKKNKNPDKSKRNRNQFLKLEEHSDNSSSRSLKNKKYVKKSEEDESEHRKEDLRHDKVYSVSNSKNETHRGALPKISKAIDMFGGWGSNSSYIGHSKSSQKQESNFEFSSFSYSNEVVSKNEETAPKKISMEKNDLDKNPLRDSKTNSVLKKNDNVVSNKKTFSANVIDEKCQKQDNATKLDTAFFSKAVDRSSKSDTKEISDSLDNKFSYKKNKTPPVKDDVVNSIVPDCTDLSLKSLDLLSKETVPLYDQTEKTYNSISPSNNSTLPQRNNVMQQNVSEHFQQSPKYLSLAHDVLMDEKISSNLNQSDNQNILANETTKNDVACSLNNIPGSSKNTFSETLQYVSQKEKVIPSNVISSDQDQKDIFMNETGSFNNFSSEALPNSLVTNTSDPLPSHSSQIKDNFPISFLNDSIAESNFIDPPIPAPVQPEPCQHDVMTDNLMNPNTMMEMNPQIMHQMMLLSNSFILQQLYQMNMYYKTMGGMPVGNGSPIPSFCIPPFVNVQYPIFNNPFGNISGSGSAHNPNFVPQQDAKSSPISPLHEQFDPKSQTCSSEIVYEGSSNNSRPTTVKFEDSWLSDIMSEGAAYANMDSYIPPPKMPDNPILTPNLSTTEERKVDLQGSQGYSQSFYQNGLTTQAYNCVIENPESQSKAVDCNQPPRRHDKNIGWDILGKKEVDIPDEFSPTDWGNIEDGVKNKYASWDEDRDGWELSVTQPMRNSTRYESEKSTNIRQPSRQPLAKAYQKQRKF